VSTFDLKQMATMPVSATSCLIVEHFNRGRIVRRQLVGEITEMNGRSLERAGFGPDDLPTHEVDARGREAGVKARSVVRAADLAGLIAAQAPGAP
jgi:hypothetical protein